MSAYGYPVPTVQDRLAAAVLRSIRAEHYVDEADPNADAESEYAAEQVALAAATWSTPSNRLAPHQQPLGRPAPPNPAPRSACTRPARDATA